MKLSLTANSTTNRRFLLLAPHGARLRGSFRHVEGDPDWRHELLADMQRLRGRIYLKDGAIRESDLTSDGRHAQAPDEAAWHLLVLNASGRVVGCTRYLQHHASTSFSRLRVRASALARCDKWSAPLRLAVESELELARRSGFSYVEFGGWALDETLRGTTDALRSVLFTYAWSQLIGGVLGLSMATQRNGSASILRRIGARPLRWEGSDLPPYYDPQYKCEMEILRFDSRLPNFKYQNAIDEIRSQIPTVPVICGEPTTSYWHSFTNSLHFPVVRGFSWATGDVLPMA